MYLKQGGGEVDRFNVDPKIKVKETSPFFIYMIFIFMELSKIIKKVLFESEGVEEFYEVEEYMSDTTFSQELSKISKVLKPFIQRVAPESMYIIERNRKEIMDTIFEFIDTYLINDGLGDTKIFDVETILSKGQDYYPVEFTVENKYRFMMFLLNLFSNYLKDYEGGDLRNQRILKRNKELIRIDLIHFIQLHLDFSKDDDINENKKDMNVESLIRKVLVEEFDFRKNINENNKIGDTLKSFNDINIDSLQNLTTRLIGLFKRDNRIEEKDFLKVKSMVDMIYASIDGDAEPGKYQIFLDKAQGNDLPELVKNLSSMVLRLVTSVKQFYNEIKSNNYKVAEKKLFDDINPLSKTLMLYLDMINDESEFESDDSVNESIYGYRKIYEDMYGSVENVSFLNEAEYQGRKVQLGKIMQGDIKKFKVYVKNDKGKVVKVNFGFGGKSAKGKRMTIKKHNPERRRSFRARHNCDNPGPRWKPRYLACRTW